MDYNNQSCSKLILIPNRFSEETGFEDKRYLSKEGRILNLESSIPFNSQLFPFAIESPIYELSEKLFVELNNTKTVLNLKREALTNIICNLVQAKLDGKVVAISRRPENYSANDFYGAEHCTYTIIIGQINSLIAHGYVEQAIGYFYNEDNSRRSRIWATIKLCDLLECNGIATEHAKVPISESSFSNLYVHTPLTKQITYKNPIVLKGENNKQKIPYTSNEQNSHDRNKLIEYNKLMMNHELLIPFSCSPSGQTALYLSGKDSEASASLDANSMFYSSNPQPTSSTALRQPTITGKDWLNPIYKPLNSSLYRVYNYGNFDLGGRFYGAQYQSYSSNIRSILLLDAQPTVEYDFSAYHITMLFHGLNIKISSDPYDLYCGNDLLRKAVKLMVNTAINAPSKNVAIKAFNWNLNRWYNDANKQEEKFLIKEELITHGISAQMLLDKIQKSHHHISQYLCSGVGLRLQNKDSLIASDILEYFTQQSIPCLCMHDSFLVQEQYGSDLEVLMRSTYKEHLGFECGLKLKSKTSVESSQPTKILIG